MVSSSEFRTKQYRDDDHRNDTHHFTMACSKFISFLNHHHRQLVSRLLLNNLGLNYFWQGQQWRLIRRLRLWVWAHDSTRSAFRRAALKSAWKWRAIRQLINVFNVMLRIFSQKNRSFFLEISEIDTIYFWVEGLPLKLKTVLMWII